MKNQTYVGVLVKCNNQLLLCKRNTLGSYPGMWSMPAGKVEDGEETKDAARREFLEETNIDIQDRELTFVGVIPRYTRDGKKVKGFMYVYLLEVDDPLDPDLENAVDGDEHSECGYFPLNKIRVEDSGEFIRKIAEIILK